MQTPRPVRPSLALIAAVATAVVGLQAPAARAAAAPVTTWAGLVAAAQAGGTVSLGSDIEQNAGDAAFVVASGRSLSLDLAGHVLTAEEAPDGAAGLGVPSGAALTVTDAAGGGKLYATGGVNAAGIGGAVQQDSGTVTVAGGSVSVNGGQGDTASPCYGGGAGIGGGCHGASGTYVQTGGSVDVDGGRYAAGVGGGYLSPGSDDVAGSVDIRGGALTARGSLDAPAIGGGGSIGGDVIQRPGQLRVSGGSVAAFGAGRAGAVNVDGYSTRAGEVAVLVTGGTLTADGSNDAEGGAGIAGTGRVEVTGGTLVATDTGGAPSEAGMHIGPSGTAVLTGSATSSGGTTIDNDGLVRVPASSGLVFRAESHNAGTLQVDGTLSVRSPFTSSGRITGTGTVHAIDRIETPPGATVADNGQGPAGKKLLVDQQNYTLTFDVNPVLVGTPKDLHVYAPSVQAGGQVLPVPSTAPSGKSFAGWFTARTGGTQVLDPTNLATLLTTAPSTLALHAQYATPQQIVFTTTPARPAAGHLYRATATGGTSGNPVALSVDKTTAGFGTERATCTLSGTTVEFRHAGKCVLAADQAGASGLGAGHTTQTIAVAKGSQDIAFTAPVPASDSDQVRGTVGDSTRVTTTRGGSPNPVVLSVDAATTGAGTADVACVLSGRASGSFVTFRAPGTCTLAATQDGDVDYPAGRSTVDIRVAAAPPPIVTSRTHVTLASRKIERGVGTRATATVTTPAGTPSGAVQFAVDGTDEGAPVTLRTVDGGQRASAVVAATTGTGQHSVTARFVPDDDGTATSTSDPAPATVALASTDTTVTATDTELIATVTGGTLQPTGTVSFVVDDTPAGTITLVDSRARLARTLSDHNDHVVQADYSGDDNHAASRVFLAVHRHSPYITAAVTSPTARASSGWYRDTVTVTFTCAPENYPVTSCSDPVTLTRSAADQSATGSAVASDGSRADVTVDDIDIDRVPPTVAVIGVRDGARYLHRVPAATCSGRDSLSGLASCRVTRTAKSGTVTVRAVATDNAGNTATATAVAGVSDYVISGAPVRGDVYTLQRGATYSVYAVAPTRPRLLAVTRYPAKASGSGVAFARSSSVDGVPRWVVRTAVSKNYVVGRDYALNVKVGSTVHLMRFRVAGAPVRAHARTAADGTSSGPTAYAIRDRVMRLSWPFPSRRDDYDGMTIRRAAGTTAPTATSGRLVADLPPGTSYFDDTAVDPATTYSYSFFARSLDGDLDEPRAVTVTTPPDGTGWQPGADADPPRGGLRAVSCVASAFCAAVDRFGGVVTYDGERWSAAFPADPGRNLTSVSCVSASFCLAVDSAFGWLRWDGSRWLGRVPVDPAFGGAANTAVSCASVTSCVVVGGERAAEFDGMRWTASAVVDPGHNLTAVSCSGDDACTAVDDDGYALRRSGGTWGRPERVVPAEAGSGGPLSVSCAEPDFCVVGASNSRVVVLDGTWGAPVRLEDNQVSSAGVSCRSRTSCVAATTAKTFRFDGATWTAVPDTDPRYRPDSTAISCPTDATCVVTDAENARMRSGAGWSDFVSIDPRGGVSLAAVSCPTADGCVALDGDGYGVTLANGFWGLPVPTGVFNPRRLSCATLTACVALTLDSAYVYDGRTWTRAAVPTPNPPSLHEYMRDVSCVAQTFCLLVTTGSVYRYDGTSWTWLKNFPGRDPSFEAVSCATTTSCTVVGTGGTHSSRVAYTYDGAAWSAPVAIGTGSDTWPLADLDCPAPTSCVGVSPSGVGIVFDGTGWTTTRFTLPEGDDPVGLSCSAANSCLVLGRRYAMSVRNGVRSTYDTGSTDIADVACRSATACTAISGDRAGYEFRTG